MHITFIGGGNMARALIGGLRGQEIAAERIHVVEPDADKRQALQEAYHIRTEADATASLPDTDVLVLAVKPQSLQSVAVTLRTALGRRLDRMLVLSIAAGVRVGDLQRWLGGHSQIIRAMPNTPALVGAGVTGLYAPAGVGQEARQLAEEVLRATGSVVWVHEEARLDAITAISGSGPAYVFYFLESLQAAGEDLGLDAATARALAYGTVHGAMALALATSETPAQLRANVTSPRGTTERGIAVLRDRGLPAAMAAATQAAAARAVELGDELGKDA
jgi:pyrroline-5-carboxylate reductase